MRRHPRRRPLRVAALRWLAVAVIVGLSVAAWQVATRGSEITSTATRPSATAPAGEVLVRTQTVDGALRTAPPSATLTGRTSGVRLLAYGFVAGYENVGSRHSAPAGQRLLAFRISPTAGEAGQAQPTLAVRVGTDERGPLVVTSDYVVTSVPQATANVDLLLDDGGVTQSLSLLDGTPGSANATVCQRSHLTARINASQPVSVQVRNSSGTAGLASGVFTLQSVSLSFWAADGSHPSSMQRALLHIQASVRLAGDTQSYGAEPALLSVVAPAMAAQSAHNAAADSASGVDAVAEVPATITSGSVRYAGSWTTPSGTMTVMTPVVVPFAIPAH